MICEPSISDRKGRYAQMANDGSVVIGTELDESGFSNGLKGLGNIAVKGLSAVGYGIGAATGAALAFGKASVDAGMNFDASMSQVAATMGLTVDQIGNLRDYALDMGASTAFSASEAADALNYMALAGYDAEQSMEMLPNVLNLAAAGGIALASASDMVTDAQSALGLSSEQTTQLVDKMAKASSRSNTSVAQLGDAILTVGGTARDLAGGTTELTTVLGLLADNGIKGAEGGTALRNVILSLTAPTDKAAKQMKELGLEVLDANGNMRPMQEIFGDLNDVLGDMTQGERTQVLNEIFNKVDLKSVNALLNTNVKRWGELTDAIDNAQGAAEQMAATQLDNLAGDITLFKSALEGAQITLSDALTPSLRMFVQTATREIGKLDRAFQNGGISGFASQLGESLGDAVNMVLDAAPQMIEAGAQLAGSLISTIGSSITSNAPYILRAALNLVGTLGEGIVAAIPDAMGGLGELIAGVILNIPKAIEIGGELIAGIGQGLIEGIPALGAPIVDALVSVVTGATGDMTMEAQKLLDDIKTEFDDFQAQTQKDIDDTLGEIDAKASQAQKWLDIFDALSTKQNLSAAEQEKLNQSVSALNTLFPDLGLKLDEETGKWSMNTDEIKRNIDMMKARAKAEIYLEKSKETLGKIVDLEIKQKKAWEDYQESVKESGEAQQKVDDLRSAHSELNDALVNSKLFGNDWKAVEASLSQSTRDWATANGVTLNSNYDLIKAMALLELQTAGAVGESSDAAQAASVLEDAYNELGRQIETLNGQYEDLFSASQTATKQAETSGAQTGTAYAAGIESTADKARVSGAALHLAAIDGANDSGGFNRLGSDGGSSYSSGIRGQKASAKAAGEELRKEAASGASGGNFYSIGYNMGAGVADGLAASRGSVETQARLIVSAANKSMRQLANINSPSRLTRDQVGIPLGEGVVVGLEQSLGDIDEVLDREINGTIAEENRRVANGNVIDAERAAVAENEPRYVETKIDIDGRQVAKTTTPYISKEIVWSR